MDKKTILGYDVAALKKNITRLDREIEMFKQIVKKSFAQKRLEQAETFNQAILDAEKKRDQLKEYVRMIEGAAHGN